MKRPKISVCIPVYNAARILENTLKSAQRQTWDNIEIVICVDPSSDDTLEWCHAAARHDARITVHENSERYGWGGNVRQTIEKSTSAWWSVLPQDDLWHPDYLSTLWQCLDNSTADFSYCDLQAFSGTSSLGTQSSPDFDAPDAYSRLLDYYRCAAVPNCWHGLFPASLAEKTPFCSEPFNFPALDNFWTNRVLCDYRGIRFPAPMYFKRMSSKELQTCTWWWNHHGETGERLENWKTIKSLMLRDISRTVDADTRLANWLDLSMDIRCCSRALLSDQLEHASERYQRWVPDENELGEEDSSLRWLLAARCSEALGETERSTVEAIRATKADGAGWRAWHNLAQHYAQNGDFLHAQSILIKGRDKHPNQFQLEKLFQSVSKRVLGGFFEESPK